ncbi:hypothetical protein M23134_06170 [Microscilla marina ATCC 23134]|uniref:Uncharacterized protein n=1 Tax=Microscilla marina ATCC 23134 TaxID=313606 RepID=A1ZSR1_MICM2|nr:hypothetical protein M23134_06170 [Microscilla marina ATCC 23134]
MLGNIVDFKEEFIKGCTSAQNQQKPTDLQGFTATMSHLYSPCPATADFMTQKSPTIMPGDYHT